MTRVVVAPELVRVGVLLLPIAVAGQAAAQESWSIEARVGLASPKGDLGDLHDEGFYSGLTVGYHFGSSLELRLEVGFESLERGGRPDRLGGAKGPLADLWHVTALVALELADPTRSRWDIGVGAGGGITRHVVGGSPTITATSGWWPTTQATLWTGFRVTPRATLFTRVDLYLMVEDSSEGYLGKELSLVNSIGIRFRP